MREVKLNPFDVVVVSSRGIIQYLIKWRSLSKWNHCFMVKNSAGEIYDIVSKGVIDSNISEYDQVHIAVCRYKNLNIYNQNSLRIWCDDTKKKSKGYDFLGLLGFVLFKPSTEDSERWFCSEFCYNAFQLNDLLITNQHTKFPYPSLFYKNLKFSIIDEGILNKDFCIKL